MLHNLTGWHALIVLAILLLVFGSTKLPSLAKGVGQSMRILKDEVREEKTASTRDDAAVPYRQAS
ncbi:twin-arginine translocase TatA/TatE family subunit [Rhodococcus fascians]|nr:twin-arginine translocase TatA/TatE family subunit [Rhodococcus fascians]